MNMLTKSRICAYSVSREAAMPVGGLSYNTVGSIVGQRHTLGRDDPHLPPGKPWPRHPPVGCLHTWQPTAKPGG